MTDGFKLVGSHRDGCYAESNEYTFVIDGPHEWNRRKNGDLGGSTLWFSFVCNDAACEAVALVRWDTLAAFVNEGIRGSSG